MHIKSQTVIPAGTKITRCPPSEGKAKSVWALERAHEKRLEKETEFKKKADEFTKLIKSGVPMVEALKLLLNK